jgi:murein DD-endopeptidase MepM/ murein hydrolase activator NlpD
MLRRVLMAIFTISLLGVAPLVHAEMNETVEDLNLSLKDKQDRVKELDDLISGYKKRISSAEHQSTDLENQLVLLDNRVKEKELAVERAKTEIESLGLEIRLIEKQISSQEERIQKDKELLATLLRDVHRSDAVSEIDILIAKPSLSEFFSQIEQIKSVQKDLQAMLQRVRGFKADLENKQRDREAKQKSIEDERAAMRKDQLALEAESNFKASLLSETEQSQQEFERIVYELNQQQQETAGDISDLELRLREQLKSTDDALARGDILFNWPLDASRGITAIFHDPTYPFRNLFEHPGTDVRASVGTQVKAAAGGYVAWNKTGRMYGNYTMIVHPGGFATVYAHLSRFLAKPDTYVQRQDAIGLSGGRPGDPGAGLSTGPHLHFEVREDGIPVDAENYLPNVPNSYYDYYDEYKKLKVR